MCSGERAHNLVAALINAPANSENIIFSLALVIILALLHRQYCTCNSAMLHFVFRMGSDQNINSASGKRVALGVTGGIAAYKAIEILRGLQRAGCEVRVAMTRHACEFVQPLTFRALSGSYVIVDDYAVDNPDPIAHITFSQSVDSSLWRRRRRT